MIFKDFPLLRSDDIQMPTMIGLFHWTYFPLIPKGQGSISPS